MNKKIIFFKALTFLVFLTSGFAMSAYAEVYKWKQGKVIQYSDIPPQTAEPYEALKTKKIVNPPTQEAPVLEPPKSILLLKNELPTPDKPNAKKTQEQQEIDRKAREKSCATAKDNLQKLKNGGSIYKENAKGERTYLDEKSIQMEISAAEKEIQASCV